jgi:DNA-directed RNA polymerase specialized sigma24 family protein
MVEEYAALRAKADTSPRGMRALLQLADLDYVLARLPLKYWEVVLLHGLIGLSQEQTAELLRISQQAVSKRYRLGLEEATYYINGGLDG